MNTSGGLQAEITAEVIEAYGPMLKRVVHRFGREHIAEECMQEATMGLLETYREHRLDAPAFPGIAYARARSRVRRLVWNLSGPLQQCRTGEIPPAVGVEIPSYSAHAERWPKPSQATVWEGRLTKFTDPAPGADDVTAQAQLTRRVQERVTELTAFMSDLEAEAVALLLGPVQPPRWTEAAERLGTTTEALTVARRRAERLLRKGISEEMAAELINP